MSEMFIEQEKPSVNEIDLTEKRSTSVASTPGPRDSNGK
jgi:hypothetical protein